MIPIHKKIGSRYSSYASLYKQYCHNDHSDDVYIKKLIKSVPENGTILDVGCGTGRDLKTVTSLGFNVFGIDASEEMVKIARNEITKSNISIGDASKLSFEDSTFDAVLSSFVLEHLRPKYFNKALREIHRVLKMNAVFLLLQHDDDINGYLPDLMTGGKKKLYRYMIPNEKLRTLIERIGFEILFLESKKYGPEHSSESADKQVAIISRKL